MFLLVRSYTELRTQRPNLTRRLSDSGLERVLQDRLRVGVAIGWAAVAVVGRRRHGRVLLMVVVVLVAAVAVAVAAGGRPRLRVARHGHLPSGRLHWPLAVVVGETGRRPIQRLL